MVNNNYDSLDYAVKMQNFVAKLGKIFMQTKSLLARHIYDIYSIKSSGKMRYDLTVTMDKSI